MAPRGKKLLPHFFLREWREFNNMTQEQVAEELGVTQPTVSRQESGAFDHNFLKDAAKLFGCEIHDFFLVNPKEEGAVASIIGKIRRAPADQQRRAEAVIDAMLRGDE